jgi:hypothetical protein
VLLSSDRMIIPIDENLNGIFTYTVQIPFVKFFISYNRYYIEHQSLNSEGMVPGSGHRVQGQNAWYEVQGLCLAEAER